MHTIHSIQQLNQLCFRSCFELQYNIKTQAEKAVFSIIKELITQPDKLQSLLKSNISQISLFVFSEYICKQLKEIPSDNLSKIVNIMLGILSSCYDETSGKIIRGGITLENYIINSIFMLITDGIKITCRTENNKDLTVLNQYTFGSSFDLLFWRQLTKTFSTIDYSIGFLCFRSLVFFYQENGMPIAVKSLLPHFLNISHVVKINELTVLQDNLSVGQSNNVAMNQEQLIKFSDYELFIAKNVLELIEEMLNFPYSITYAEYDFDIEYTHSVIYFPDSITKLILQNQFYQSLFFLTQRFLIERPNDDLLFVCLDSLKKIVLTRFTFFSAEEQKIFIEKTLNGMTSLMRTTNSSMVLLDILQLNTKIINNIQLKRMRNLPKFNEWMNLIQTQLGQILLNKPFKYHDIEFISAFALIQKLNSGFKHPKLQHIRPIFFQMTHRLMAKVLVQLGNQKQSLASDMIINTVKEVKAAAQQFYSAIRIVLLYNFQKSIDMLHQFQTTIFTNLMSKIQDFNIETLINLINLMSSMIHTSVLTFALSLPDLQNNKAYHLFSIIINNQLQYTSQHYKSIGARFQHNLLNTSVMIFLEVFLIDLCSNMNAISKSPRKKINHANKKSFQSEIQQDDGFHLQSQSKAYKITHYPKLQFQTHLSSYINLLMKHLQSGDPKHIAHVLEVINVCIMKIKWSIKRTYFKKLPFIQQILKFCMTTTLSNFQSEELLKSRTQLMRLVSVLAFDDCLDSYTSKIDSVLNNLNKDNIMTLLHDIKGIAEQIDAPSIFRYFLKKSYPYIQQILEVVCTHYLNNQKYLRITIKVCKKYLSNNKQRLNYSNKCAFSIYKLVSMCIPYWQIIINFLMNKIDEDSEEYLDCSKHMIDVFRYILEGKHINLCMLRQACPAADDYVLLNYRFITLLLRTPAYHYPETKKVILGCCKYMIEDLSEYLFGFDSKGEYALQVYGKLFTSCLKIFYQQINQVIANDNDRVNQFTMVINFMTQALVFLYNSFFQQHNVRQFTRACQLKQLIRQQTIQMTVSYFNSYTMMSTKGIKSVVDRMARYLAQVIRIYPENAKEVVEKIQQMIPRSSTYLLVRFFEIVVSSEDKGAWCDELARWKEDLKNTEILEKRMAALS